MSLRFPPALLEQDISSAIVIESAEAMAATPRVSVLMLAYNHAAYIAQAIESVISQQTNFSFELLIGEDCSTDGTSAIVERYQRLYPHIIRIVTATSNIGGRRNHFRAMVFARGDYFAFCEGDDWWVDKKKLQLQCDLMDADPHMAMCFHSVIRYDQRTGRYGALAGFGRRSKNLRFRNAIIEYGTDISTCSMFIRRSAYPPMEDWNVDSPVGDYPMKIWSVSQGTCRYVPRLMAVYRVGLPASWSGRTRNREEIWQIRRRTIDMLRSLNDRLKSPEAESSILRQVSLILRNYLLESGGETLSNLDGASQYFPFFMRRDRALLAVCRVVGISRYVPRVLAKFARLRRRVRFLSII